MDGNMRRLPPWMIAGASSGVIATGNPTDNKSVEVEIKHEAESPKTKKKRKTRKESDDSKKPKQGEIRKRGVGRKVKEEEAKPSIDDGKSPEIVHSVTSPEEEDLTVDDLLSFAHEYVKGDEEDQAKVIQESLSTSKSMGVDESNMRSSKGETNGTRDPTSEDMINLLLGPFFKKSGTK